MTGKLDKDLYSWKMTLGKEKRLDCYLDTIW